jgi:site-specific recombinase XerC
MACTCPDYLGIISETLESLREQGLTGGTIRTRWRGLRRFVGWLVAEGILAADPLAGISVERPEPPPVPVLADEELAALLAAYRG